MIGYIANRKHGFNRDEVDAVKEMLYINALRGKDSTGVFYVNNRMDVQVHKEVGDSAAFLKTKEWEATDKELFRNGQAIVGHCRASTRGAKTDENAHPFIVDNKIVLVHNGTYNGSHESLAKTDVDSHAIAHAISEAGNDIPSALRRVNAAYALVWYNNETKHLYAVRNKHRPLWFAQLEDGSMMFASEVGFLYTTAWRNGLKIHKDYPVMLPEHQLFSCDLSDVSKPYNWDDIDAEYVYIPPVKEEPKKVEPKSQVQTTDNTKRHYNGVPSLTEVAMTMGIGKVELKDYGTEYYKYAGQGSQVLAQVTDYHAVDDTAGVYYVFGKIISSKPGLNGMIAGWEITADHEYEVLELVDKFFNCTVEWALSRGPSAKPGVVLTVVWKMKSVVEAQMVPVETLENA